MGVKKAASTTGGVSVKKEDEKSCVGCVHLFLDNGKKAHFCTHPVTVKDLNGMTSMENHQERPMWCKGFSAKKGGK